MRVGRKRDRAEPKLAIGFPRRFREPLGRVAVPVAEHGALGFILRGLLERLARDPALRLDQGRVRLRLGALLLQDLPRCRFHTGSVADSRTPTLVCPSSRLRS